MVYEEVVSYLNERLDLREFLSPLQIEKFYLIIAKYLTNRTTLETFKANFEETLDFYSSLDISLGDALSSIMKWPSVMHANKEELFKKYLLLAKVVDASTGEPVRDDVIINHPKDLMTGFELMYARTMFFLNPELDMVRNNNITRRKLIKTTNDEFEQIYGISKADILSRYPVPENILDILLSWDENGKVREVYESKKSGRQY